MLSLGHAIRRNVLAAGIHISHIHFADTYILACCCHQLEHVGDGILLAVLRAAILIIRDVHLRADTVNLGNAICLPLLYPVDERLQLLVLIPVRLKVIVVDEEHNIFRTILTGKATSLTNIFEVAHEILPVESITAYIPSSIGIISFRVLQCVVALTVITATGDSLVDEIPCLDLAFTGSHHTLDPLVHSIDEGVVTLLL